MLRLGNLSDDLLGQSAICKGAAFSFVPLFSAEVFGEINKYTDICLFFLAGLRINAYI